MTKFQREKQVLLDAHKELDEKTDSYLTRAIDSPETGPKADKILADVKNSSNSTAIIAGAAIGVTLSVVAVAYYMFK